VPPGCEAALLACCLQCPGLSALMQRLCSGTADRLISVATNQGFYHPDPCFLFLWSQLCPGQPSPFLSPSKQNQALKKNTKHINKCAQMTQQCYQQVCKNEQFSRVTPNMKNCDLTAQAVADGGSSDPDNHEKEQQNTTCEPTLSTHFSFGNMQKMPKLVPCNYTFGIGKPHVSYFLDIVAQSSPKGVHNAAQGSPWYPKWSPKCAKSVRKWNPRVNQS